MKIYLFLPRRKEYLMTLSFLKDLNAAQREAVEYIDGPMMVVAGAGSGKTRLLTYKIAYLIESGMDPYNILALTFTNKAAREMKERVFNLIGKSDSKSVWLGTFHSICARLLRKYGQYLGYPSNFTIYDTDDAKSVIKSIVKDMKLDNKTYTANYILNRISASKTNLINATAYAANIEFIGEDIKSNKPEFANIFKEYTIRLKKSSAMDFDDLLFNMNIILKDIPEVLYELQKRFSYILVDEYQDTNYSQYLIIKRLAAMEEMLCVVGDDAQSIYGFRGASIENILNIKNDYSDLKVFKLEQNYRSTQNIVNAANSIIKNNKDRLHKEVWTKNEEGNLIKLIKASTENDEGVLVAQNIFETKMNLQLPNTAFAILYRTNAQSRPLEEALRKLNIPYRIYGGLSFYQRKEIKDLLAYFRLVVNPNDEEALTRIINYPARGIGKTTMAKIIIIASENNITMWETLKNLSNYRHEFRGGTTSKVQEFITMIRSLQVKLKEKDAYSLGVDIAVKAGLIDLLSEDKTPEGISRFQNIEELLNGLKEFTDTERPEDEFAETEYRTLDEFMQNVALLTDQDKDDKDDTDRVTLMTVHSAKGLEFPYVFIVGLEEELFPNFMSMGTRAELEEERRLFYVALTRAEKQATISYANSRMRWGNYHFYEPSRFIDEIDPKYIEKPKIVRLKNQQKVNAYNEVSAQNYPTGFKRVVPSYKSKLATNTNSIKVGVKVFHERFGKGVVKSIEGKNNDMKAIVAFDSVGEKKLLLRFAKLEIED